MFFLQLTPILLGSILFDDSFEDAHLLNDIADVGLFEDFLKATTFQTLLLAIVTFIGAAFGPKGLPI